MSGPGHRRVTVEGAEPRSSRLLEAATSSPWRIAVTVLVVATFALRFWLVSQWSWYGDDFGFSGTVEKYGFGHYVFQDYNGHVMPLQFLLMWLMTTLDPMNHAWVTVVTALFAAATVVTWAMALRELFGERVQALVLLVLLAWTPCMLGTSLWWSTSLPAYSLQSTMGLCVYFLARWLLRGQQRGDLLKVLGAYVLALLFWEKGLLISMVLFFVVLVVADGRLGARIKAAVRVLWPVAAVSIMYIAAYVGITRSSSLGGKSEPPVGRSPGDMLDFYWHAVADLALPSLVGGPFSDLTISDASYPDAPTPVRIVVLSLLAVGLVLGLRYRRHAAYAVAMAVSYAAFAWGLVLFNYRFDLFGIALAQAPRYWSDSLAVTLLAIGFLTMPTRTRPDEDSLRRPVSPRTMQVLRSASVNVLCVVTALTAVTVGRSWGLMEQSSPAPWYENLRADARAVGKATIYDAVGPVGVVGLIASDDQRVSNTLAPLDLPLSYNVPTENLLIANDEGHLVLGQVPAATTAVLPGPSEICGYGVDAGKTTRIPMTGELFAFEWIVQLQYFTESDAVISVAIDGDQVEVPLSAPEPGSVGQMQLVVDGAVPDIRVTGVETTNTVCITEVAVGSLEPSDRKPSALTG